MSDDSSTHSPVSAGQVATKPRFRRGWLPWVVLLAVVAVVAYAVVVRPLLQKKKEGRAGYGGGAMPVTAVQVRNADLDVKLSALGTVTPVSTVTVRTQVSGELQKIYFTEGQTVAVGEPLAEIDPRPYEVQKAQAEAQLAKDQALLDNARLDLQRFNALLAQDSVAKQQVDSQAALVRQYEASLKVDQAQIDSAGLQIAYAHITSPIAGRIGLRLVDVGNIVSSSDASGLAVITQLSPITVLFSIPQSAVRAVMKTFATGVPMVVQALDADGTTVLDTGRLVTIDNQMDLTTGTVKLRAEFPNAHDALFSNQFVNIRLTVEHLVNVPVVPSGAVQIGAAGDYVYVVSDKQTVSVRPVVTGATEQGVVQITKGLAPGETVVVDGVDKLRDGSAVELISTSSGRAPKTAKPKGAAGRHHHAQS